MRVVSAAGGDAAGAVGCSEGALQFREGGGESSFCAEGALQFREGGGEGGFVVGFEEGGAGDKGVGPGATAIGGGGEIDAAVNFETEVKRAIAAPGVDLFEFRQQIVAEGLAAEARLDGHDQNEIDHREERFDGGGGRVGIEHEAGLATEIADLFQGGGVVVGGFDMDADEIGAGFGEGIDVTMRFGEHQVGVEEKFQAVAAEGGEGFGAEGEVWHEMAIHDVEVQPGESEVLDDAGAGGEMGVVAGEQGGSEDRREHGAGR